MNKQYYVVEGLDRSGKTTLIRKLADRLKSEGREVLVVKEPSDQNDQLAMLRKLIVTDGLSNEAKIFIAIAQRLELYKKTILPALQKGITVISDRNFLTSCLYQACESYSPYHILMANLTELSNFEGGGIPSHLIYVSISYEEFLKRINTDGDIVDIEVPLLDRSVYESRSSAYSNIIKQFGFGSVHAKDIKVIFYETFDKLIEEIK